MKSLAKAGQTGAATLEAIRAELQQFKDGSEAKQRTSWPGVDLTAERLQVLSVDFASEYGASNQSSATYRRGLQRFFAWIAEQEITRPIPVDIEKYRTYLVKEAKTIDRQTGEQRQIKDTTASAYMTAVKRFFAYLQQQSLYMDPSTNSKPIKVESGHRKDAMTAEQAREVLAKIETDTEAGARDYALIMLMLNTGLRAISIQRAQRGDLGSERGRKVLRYQSKGEKKKGSKAVLNGDALEALKNYMQQRGPVSDNAPLFASVSNNNAGGPMSTRSISRVFKQYADAAGVTAVGRITMHSTRHTAATEILDRSGDNIRKAQQALGHKSVTTTERYAHDKTRIIEAPELLLQGVFSCGQEAR